MMIDKIGDKITKKLSNADKRLDSDSIRANYMTEQFMQARVNAFEISNVVPIALEIKDPLDTKVEIKSFPNIAPLFADYWMEFVMPREYDLRDRQIGAFISWFNYSGKVAEISHGTVLQKGKDRNFDFNSTDLSVMIVEFFQGQDRVSFLGQAVFVRSRDSDYIRLLEFRVQDNSEPFSFRKYDQEIGRMSKKVLEELGVKDPDNLTVEEVANLRARENEIDERVLEETEKSYELMIEVLKKLIIPPVLMAHSLLACKNVSTETHRPDLKVQKARKRKGLEPKVTFKTLIINPMGGATRSGLSYSIGDGQTAMHLVRGHFKTFTKDKPLFGSRVGTWWWSPLVRGNPEYGTVIKDYEIKV